MRINSLLVLLLLLPQTVAAISLEEMQGAALENRALVKKYITSIEKSSESTRVATKGYYPSVDLGYNSYSLDEESSVEHRENSVAYGAISWNIFAGFKDKYTISSSKILEQVEALRLQTIEQDIQLSAALRYLDVYNQQARMQVAKDTYNTLKELYIDGENRYEVGLLDKNGVLKFKVDFDNANLGVQREEAGLRKSLYSLERVIGISISLTELNFDEFQQMPDPVNEDEISQQMVENRSELKVLNGLVSSAEQMVNAKYGEYYPELGIVGKYQRYDDSYLNGNGESVDEELRAELVLTFNLFDGFKDDANIAIAKADVRGLKYDYLELESLLTTELKSLFVDFEIGLANVQVAKNDILYANENLRITELKYKEGLQRQIDLLDAVSNKTRAQSNYVAVVRTVFDNYFKIIRMIEGFDAKG